MDKFKRERMTHIWESNIRREMQGGYKSKEGFYSSIQREVLSEKQQIFFMMLQMLSYE